MPAHAISSPGVQALASVGYVVAAPGLGFTLGSNEFSNVRVPVQLWSGEQNDKVACATNVKPAREALAARVESHSVPHAGHLSFLVPCGELKPPDLCSDPARLDRNTFHTEMNASVQAIFDEHLRQP